MGWGLGDIANAVIGGVGAYGAYKSSNDAGKAYDRQGDALKQQMRIIDQIMALGAEAGDEVETAFDAFYDRHGSGYDPGQFDARAGQYIQGREADRARTRGLIDDESMQALGYRNNDPAFALASRFGDVPDYQRDARQVALSNQNVDAPTGAYGDQFAALVNRNRNYYKEAADDRFEQALGQVEADSARRGLGMSTYDLEGRRRVADFGAEQDRQAHQQAIQAALSELGGLQGLEGGLQGQRLAAQTGDLNVSQLDLARINAAGQLGSGAYRDRIAGAQAGSGLANEGVGRYLNARQGGQGFAQAVLGGIYGDLEGSEQSALANAASRRNLRQGAFKEMIERYQTPLALKTGFSGPAGSIGENVIAGYGDQGQTYSKTSGTNFAALSDVVARFMGKA